MHPRQRKTSEGGRATMRKNGSGSSDWERRRIAEFREKHGDTPEKMKIIDELFRAYGKGVNPPDINECDPLGLQGRERLRDRIVRDVEPHLINIALGLKKDEVLSMVVAALDLAQQSRNNVIGGRNGAGDACIETYFKVNTIALALVAAINGGDRVSTDFSRVSPTSDEGIGLITGMHLPRETELQFELGWKLVRDLMDLRKIQYELFAGGERFLLDLDGYSQILRHPDSVVACHQLISRPIRIKPNLPEGFILEAIRALEDNEIGFKNFLPGTLKRNGGIAEVSSPFATNLTAMGTTTLPEGILVETKFGVSPETAKQLLVFTSDDWGKHFGIMAKMLGTRKGFALHSYLMGMSVLNTFLGKAVSNEILSSPAHAMGELAKLLDIYTIPIGGGYLHYYVAPKKSLTREQRGDLQTKIRELIDRRIHSPENGAPGHINIEELFPKVSLMDAKGVDINDVADLFTLKSLRINRNILEALGTDASDTRILDTTNFLVCFTESLSRGVRDEIIERMEISRTDQRYFDTVKSICAARERLRNTEDIIWTVRRDKELEFDKQKRKDLEKWIFEFAYTNYERMFYMLARKIDSIIKSRG